jgi:subtilisin family serine protease
MRIRACALAPGRFFRINALMPLHPQAPFAPQFKIAPELQPLLREARLAAKGAGLAPHQPAFDPEEGTSYDLGPPDGEEEGMQDEQQQEQQEKPEQQQEQQEQPRETRELFRKPGAAERSAHEALLAHPIARQLRTATRAGAWMRDGRSSSGSRAGGDTQGARVLIGVRFASVVADDLPSGTRFAPAEAAAVDWAAPLASLATSGGAAAGCVPAAHVEGARSLTVSACAHELGAVVEWLARQPQVHWLEPRRRMQLHNRIASAVTQGGVRGAPGDPSAASAAAHPFFAAGVGLRGEGQLIGVGDSGLDMDSCFFFDPAVSFAAGIQDSPAGKVFASDTHRKVAYYRGRADTTMLDTVGHGTHTSGTLAGAALGAASDADSPATGMAPGARLGFMDLSSADGSGVMVPDDLDAGYFPLAFNRGVRIHSGEWLRRGCGRGCSGGAAAGSGGCLRDDLRRLPRCQAQESRSLAQSKLPTAAASIDSCTRAPFWTALPIADQTLGARAWLSTTRRPPLPTSSYLSTPSSCPSLRRGTTAATRTSPPR